MAKTAYGAAGIMREVRAKMLRRCGLTVDASIRRHIYFQTGAPRLQGVPQADVVEGLWREPVVAPSPWARTAEDDEEQRDRVRPKGKVATASYEWSCGAGGVED